MLAVDQRARGKKLGAAWLQDAVNRTLSISQQAGVRALLVHALDDRGKQFYGPGVRALLVHALDDRGKQFYGHYGFQESPLHAKTLMLRLKGAKP